MAFLKSLFDNKERCRNFVRSAYNKAFADAARGTAGGTASPHEVGLYSALGNFYVFRGMRVGDMELWPELLPFLLMRQSDSVEALAEYAVYKQWPSDAVMSRVRPQLNGVLRNMSAFDQDRKATLMLAVMLARKYIDSDGRSGHPITWFAMLDEDVRKQVDVLSSSFG